MKKTVLLLVLTFILACLTSNAFALCTACSGTEDWTASATNFIQGKPINDEPPDLTPPQLARAKNTEFNSSLLNESANSTSQQNNLASISINASNSTNVTLNSTSNKTANRSDLWGWGSLPMGYKIAGDQIVPKISDQPDTESVMETPSQLVPANNVRNDGGLLVRPKM